MPVDSWGCCGGNPKGRSAAGGGGDGGARALPPRPVRLISRSSSSVSVPKPRRASALHQKCGLWQRAEEQLNAESRKLLLIDTRNATGSIEDVLRKIVDEITIKYEEYQKGGLTIRKRGATAERVDIRGSAKKVLVCVLQAQELIKAVAAFDPTGHASTAWSIVSFGLTLVKNDIDRRDAVLDAAEFLAKTLAYHTIIEHNYRKGNIPSSAKLDDALVEVYVAILQYTAEVLKARAESVITRVGKSIAALVNQPLDQLKSAVEQKSAVVDQWKMVVRDEDQQRCAEDILMRIDVMAKQVHSIDVRTNDQEDLAILGWLSDFDYSSIQNETKKNRSPDTGTWFVQSSSMYQRWKTTSGQLLWLHGPVGCGKSVLCSTIISDTEHHCHHNMPHLLAYWYFRFDNLTTHSMESMIRSLIRQLCPRPIPASVQTIWADHRRNREPDWEGLTLVLNDIISSLPGEVFFIFDALDECPIETRERRLLLFLDELVKNHPTRSHVLATSRPEPDIHHELMHHKLFGLETALSEDIAKFVQDRLTNGRLKRWDSSIRESIKKRLLNVPERRFRWADLQIKRLERCHLPGDIDDALTTIPASLEATYRTILEQEIVPKYHEAVRSILTWLAFSLEPLYGEAVAAVAGFPSPDSVIEICTTQLVTLQTSDGVIRLAHFSVKEFLLSEQSSDWCRMSELGGHQLILNQSLPRILAEEEELSLMGAMSNSLLQYCSQRWIDHLGRVESLTSDQLPEVYAMMLKLFTTPVTYLNWQRLRSFYFQDTKHAWRRWMSTNFLAPIDAAIFLQLHRLVELLLHSGVDPLNASGGRSHQSTLVFASRHEIPVLVFFLQRLITVPPEIVDEIFHRLRPRSAEDHATLPLIIDLLWNMGGLRGSEESDTIDPSFLVSMACNHHCAAALLELCLDRGGIEPESVTQELVEAAVNSERDDASTLEVLLKRRRERVWFPEAVMHTVARASWSNPSLASLVLHNRELIACLQPEHAEIFVGGAGREIVDLVRQVYGDEIMMQPTVLRAAIGNPHARAMLRRLLAGRELSLNTRQEILAAAVAPERLDNRELVDYLLDEWGPQCDIGEQTMIAAVGNSLHGCTILQALLARQQAGFTVSEPILMHAATRNTKEVMQLLMDNGGSTIPISDELLLAAARNQPRGLSVLLFLLPLRGPDCTVSADLLEAAATNPNKYINPWNTSQEFRAVLERYQGATVPDSVFLAMHDQVDHLRVLLDWTGNRAPIKEILSALSISTEGARASDRLRLLLDRHLLVVDESKAGTQGSLQPVMVVE
ncbi:uncharacterized protein BP01DRAFT_6876 [Aspergillus saccharolyticus JOP 1030-1]|uniref:Nephrocystin 3-like N-terminal domain-containing protein n=1 Tax=Aspergillus saccharolyticus JOP 1030-1 TaxID=1450539 RepID=A0A318ZQB6_9EURO|nr:hypothetical protein BP01DRAFT_6876 [Aspergillus saccharolyticus JOP 1030-1]PYH49811.1 hypothetical protein BP01DRAFT_6876 [Aspergillus saccharolyticus JOP 1030-1]